MLNYRNGLELAEYLCFAILVAGVVASGGGLSPLYATVPLLVFLALNLANRYVLKRYLRSLSAGVKAEVDRNAGAIEQLHRVLEANAVSANLNHLQFSANLDGGALIENLGALNTNLQTILERQNALEQAIEAIQGELELVVNKFQQRPELEQVENLTHVIVDLQQFINQLPQWGTLQQQQLNELQAQVKQVVDRVSAEMDDLPRRVDVAVSDRLDNSNSETD
jgi:hypothetical protein